MVEYMLTWISALPPVRVSLLSRDAGFIIQMACMPIKIWCYVLRLLPNHIYCVVCLR